MLSQNEVQEILSQTRNASVPQMLNTLNVKLMCLKKEEKEEQL